MPQSYHTNGTRKAAWVVPVLVVGAISAVSLAVGLGVVGPMIQRRIETPPPALSISGTTSVVPSHFSSPSADVEIKERVRPRPVPKPAPPAAADALADSSQTPPTDSSTTDAGDAEAAATPAPRPTIHATVTDAGLDSNSEGVAADAPAATDGTKAKQPDTSDAGDAAADSGDSEAPGAAAGAAPRGARASKTHRRRASPLDALPPLDDDGPGTAPQDNNPKTVIPPAPDAPKSGASYRVQVGRFDTQAEAQRVRDELAKTGLSPQVVTTKRGGTVVYRVQVGTFRQKENAQRQMDTLKAQSYPAYIAEEEP